MLEVAQAEAGYDKWTRQPVVTFRLTLESAQKFADFTRANVGRAGEMRLDGKVLMRPVIREPILQGSVQIDGGFSEQDAKNLAARVPAGAKIEVEAVARSDQP